MFLQLSYIGITTIMFGRVQMMPIQRDFLLQLRVFRQKQMTIAQVSTVLFLGKVILMFLWLVLSKRRTLMVLIFRARSQILISMPLDHILRCMVLLWSKQKMYWRRVSFMHQPLHMMRNINTIKILKLKPGALFQVIYISWV